MCTLYRLGQLEWRANESSVMLLVQPEVEWAGKVTGGPVVEFLIVS